jgi:hypothetical protein
MNILELLSEKQIISEDDVKKIEKEVQSSGNTLEFVLNSFGVSPEMILNVKGEYYDIPTEDLSRKEVPFSVLKYISEDAATHYGFVPIGMADGTLNIGILDPESI